MKIVPLSANADLLINGIQKSGVCIDAVFYHLTAFFGFCYRHYG